MPHETRKLRILVVDDEAVLRTMLRRLLTKAGYEVLVAESGEVALATLTAEVHVDVLLTDVRMPDLSGPDLCRRLAHRAPSTIVFMSGASAESPEDLRRLGGRAFVSKPFRVAELLGALESAMACAMPAASPSRA